MDQSDWEAYQKVNQLFMERLLQIVEPGDQIWVHDYQLMLLPGLLREVMPDASIGFFLHIPFPSNEVFRILPWRRKILEGLMGSDLIGFHSYSYARHFLSSLLRILGLEQEFGEVNFQERMVKIDFFPLGVNMDRFRKMTKKKETRQALAELKEQTDGQKVILSVDRLDFTKGILQRLGCSACSTGS